MSLPTPYYQDDAVTIYHGDCREIIPQLDPVDAVITDPVWPNNSLECFSHINPFELLKDVAAHFPRICKRAVLQMGCLSDPRILTAIPAEFPFMRVNWLRFRPSYRGRMLVGSDVSYAFGEPPPAHKGYFLIPGECAIPTGKDAAIMDPILKDHPCPRIIKTVSYLINIFTLTGETILDPFAGSCTTARAAKDMGRKSIMIEINEKYCEKSAQRMCQEVLL